MIDRRQITHFTFLLAGPTGAPIEVQLWGSGGLLGDGILCVYDGSTERTDDQIRATVGRLLAKARGFEKKGALRIFVDSYDPAERFKNGNGYRVISARARRGSKIVCEVSL